MAKNDNTEATTSALDVMPTTTNFAAVEVSSAEDRVNNAIAALAGNGATRVWSSLQGDDFDTKMQVAAAVQDGESLRDHLGETILLRHVVVQGIYITDKDRDGSPIVDPDTGAVRELYVARVVMIAEDGKSYASISTGIFKALENFAGVLGEFHTWPKALPVKAVEQGPAMRRYLTLKMA